MQLTNNPTNTSTVPPMSSATGDALASSGVLIPYNAPAAATPSAFDQVLHSVSPQAGTAQAGAATSSGAMAGSAPGMTGLSPLPGQSTTGQTMAGQQPSASPFGAASGMSGMSGMAGTTGMTPSAPPDPFVSPRLSGAAPYGASSTTQGTQGAMACCCCDMGGMSGAAAVASSTGGMGGALPGVAGLSGASASGTTTSSGASSGAPSALQLPFAMPTTITQPFGPTSFAAEPAYDGYSHFHTGIDFGVPAGTAITAAAGGRVVAAGWDSTGFGNRVIINHGNGIQTLYGHLERVDVTPGQTVQPGQEIGLSGSTGNSTGPHLHFGAEQNGQWIDPSMLLGLSPGQTTVAPQPASPASSLTSAMMPSGTAPISPSAGAVPAAVGGGYAGTSAPLTPTVSAAPAALTGAASPNVAGLIQQTAGATGVPANLIAGVVQAESGGDANAVSPAGAKGLMQLMDGTAATYGVTNPFDPAQNLLGGATYLRSLLQRYNGDQSLALAAYNAGPGAVDQYGGIPPYAETQQYVQRVLAYAQQYAASQPGA